METRGRSLEQISHGGPQAAPGDAAGKAFEEDGSYGEAEHVERDGKGAGVSVR